MAINLNDSKIKLYLGGNKVRKVFLGTQQVYSAGNIVTYHVDANAVYQEEIDSEASCLSPKTFIPSKAGWTFMGWRGDSAASANVLKSRVMGEEPVTLYAVFRQNVTVTCYNGSTAASRLFGEKYYNNGNVANPSFTVAQTALNGWTARGWSTGTAGDSGISYGSLNNTAIASDITLYGMYQKTITLSYWAADRASASGTAYYNSNGNAVYPRFTIAPGNINGWTFNGWCTTTNAAAWTAYTAVSDTVFTDDTSLYGKYSKTISLSYNGNGADSGGVETQYGTVYYNTGNYAYPAFTLAGNGYGRTDYTFISWSLNGGTCNVGSTVTLTDSATAYARWIRTVTEYEYTGNIQAFTVPCAGTYRLEVWGAEGGWYSPGDPEGYGRAGYPYGGYASGTVDLAAGTVLYVCAGGGAGYSSPNGGYNGGGSSTGGFGGGGATHIATSNRGCLAAYALYPSEVLIAAGGGGGNGRYGSMEVKGGYGGGEAGEDGKEYGGGNGKGGTQSRGGSAGTNEFTGSGGDDYQASGQPGSFGAGGDARENAGGGGGGWYGGGGGAAPNGAAAGGGGGSGYIGGVTGGSMENGVREGNGCARITFLG